MKMMREKAMKKGQNKMAKVMGEFKEGELHSGSDKGPVVKSSAQAKAIGMSEMRKRACAGGKKK